MKDIIRKIIGSAVFFGVASIAPATSIGANLIGTIPGEFKVSSTGSAHYSIPIDAPPGVAGMTPTVTVEYDSQAGDTFMGPGFSVSGFSQISRCSSDL